MNHSVSIPDKHDNLLPLAAHFEENFSVDWITDLTGKKACQVLAVLEEGLQQGLLVKQQAGVFAFKNLKTQKDWQGRLTPKERESLHRKIVELFLRELPDDNFKAVSISSHLLHISNDVNGCRWLLKTGDIFRRSYQFNKALEFYAKVLEDLSGISGMEADSLFTEVAIKYSKISMARQDTEKVLSILQEAIKRAERADRQSDLSLLYMHLGRNEWLESRFGRAFKHFQKGWTMIKDIGDPQLLLSATTFRIFFLYWQGHLKEAVSVFENWVSNIDRYPHSAFPILAKVAVGYCYVQSGHITQGLGMLDALRKHCLEKGLHYFATDAEVAMAGAMIHLRRPDAALSYLESSLKKVGNEPNDWNQIRAKVFLSFIYFLKGENEESIHYLKVWLRQSEELKVTVRVHPYWFEIIQAMELGKLPRLQGLSLEKEVRQGIEGDNISMKGVAYRYKAFLQEKEGRSPGEIMESLRSSLKWLEEAGQKFELSRTYVELVRQHRLLGEEKLANEIQSKISEILSSFGEAFVPDDLRFFVKKSPGDGTNLIGEMLKLGQEVVTIRDHKELVQNILSTVNRITWAERGAIFILEGDHHTSRLRLLASKNLTSEQIAHPDFAPSMKIIKEVAATCKGMIIKNGSTEDLTLSGKEQIRSRVCVPMVIRNKVVGVLYHDNSLFNSSFQESDLDILAYFAAQAAVALDNARAYEEIKKLNERLNEEKQYYEEQHIQTLHFEDIVGESPAIREVLNRIEQVANTGTTVLILGETGVGKELVARAIHRHSPRRDKPFIKVLCSALPESLIPSELFGHEKGAFTGAVQRRIGRFELADRGTLFLDEIGDLPLDIQIRLLQVLQGKEFERVGGRETIRSDFRLVAATNRDLEQEVKAQRFRSDLYYRLNVFPIYVPPLRERKEDIPLLASYFLENNATKMSKTFEGIPKEEIEKLTHYDWPGNIRELENIIERGTILSHSPHFRVPELSIHHHPEFAHKQGESTLEEIERSHILRTLQKTGWKVRGAGGAAEILDIHPSTLFFRIKKLGIQRPSKSLRQSNTHFHLKSNFKN